MSLILSSDSEEEIKLAEAAISVEMILSKSAIANCSSHTTKVTQEIDSTTHKEVTNASQRGKKRKRKRKHSDWCENLPNNETSTVGADTSSKSLNETCVTKKKKKRKNKER